MLSRYVTSRSLSHGGTLWTRTLAAIPVGHVRTDISIGPVRGWETSHLSLLLLPKDLGTITVYYQMNRRIKEYRYSKPGTAHLVTLLDINPQNIQSSHSLKLCGNSIAKRERMINGSIITHIYTMLLVE